MFCKILIANRGEIACRVARSARRMGVSTVAVYSTVDANSRHVRVCDEAIALGGASAADSYLRAELIIEAALQTGADAVHPGYGFLSENADFARACQKAGLVFIGPPAAAIDAMGSKSGAKALMIEAGVPVVPGYHGDDQRLATLLQEAERVGYPLLVKAVMGGGGKGMRVVEKNADLEAALQGAQREAEHSFGDGRLLLERYLPRARHVEMQIFCDDHGKALHLFERDCSVQRRHQKVIEEAPAPRLSPDTRDRMGAAAVAAARAIDYRGAGTVEFLLAEDGAFYFMEMNTRLQVEHPVTEMITGQDLVEWQLRVAAGEPLPLQQDQIQRHGHAIEARIYAEDPDKDFLPATGELRYLHCPDPSAHVRVDTGVRSGDSISVHYDPMLAKLIVWDEDRDDALRRLQTALGQFHVVGLPTNIGFLQRLAQSPDFVRAELSTRFIDDHHEELFAKSQGLADEAVAIACFEELLSISEASQRQAKHSPDPHSPFFRRDGFRLNQSSHHELRFAYGEQIIDVWVGFEGDRYRLSWGEREWLVCGLRDRHGGVLVDLDGWRLRAVVVRQDDERTVLFGGQGYRLRHIDPLAASSDAESLTGGLAAPMPANVVTVEVEVGQKVKRGDALMVIEAMKMEHTITANADGEIGAIYFAVGDQVSEGDELLVIGGAE